MSDEKMEAKIETEHINLKVYGTDNTTMQFKIKKTAPLSKLMNAYCQHKLLDMSRIRFKLDGESINPTSTAKSLHMQDGDMIDVFGEQDGGR